MWLCEHATLHFVVAFLFLFVAFLTGYLLLNLSTCRAFHTLSGALLMEMIGEVTGNEQQVCELQQKVFDLVAVWSIMLVHDLVSINIFSVCQYPERVSIENNSKQRIFEYKMKWTGRCFLRVHASETCSLFASQWLYN